MARRVLKTGFSTGSAAAAAAKAALACLLGQATPTMVSIPLPGGERFSIAVAEVENLGKDQARAVVIKDAGDDPDVTHGAAIQALVSLEEDGVEEVTISGGPGVGRVTRPGLPVAVGQPAINPVPRQMISEALREAWREQALGVGPLRVHVEISVPEGERLARRTLNPRLGIVGGISILGTTGLVKPFSHEAYTATIDSALAVARAAGQGEVVLTTGGRSEKRAMALRPDLPALCFAQIADFFGHALRQAGRHGFQRVGVICFFGKAIKQAQGLDYTHAHQAPLELARLAGWLAEAGVGQDLCQQIRQANTARHALEILEQAGGLELVEVVGYRLLASMGQLAGGGLDLWAMILDYEGQVLFQGQRGKEAS
ncbi:MAG: cobalt-precorrin-5B (C(1))-methyltransferase [Desulfarculus sp.]|nr:cobalt-precorrin-5B (C(1))-methyltransferase [Desulfarculus sp.]